MSAADRLIQSLSLTDTDGVVILDPSNVRYFSGGFTGEGITLWATGATGIVAADGGAMWAGVTDVELPFP